MYYMIYLEQVATLRLTHTYTIHSGNLKVQKWEKAKFPKFNNLIAVFCFWLVFSYFRSKHRGTREEEFLTMKFATTELQSMDNENLKALDVILDPSFS